MKTINFLDQYKGQKRNFLAYAKCIFFNNMVLQNMEIPKGWVAIAHTFGVNIIPERVDGQERSVMADEFERVVRTVAKNFRHEPSVEIEKKTMNANFWFYPRFEHTVALYPVNIDIRCGNTEACEVIETKVEVSRFEPTGYCKALQGKKFLAEKKRQYAELHG